MLARKCERCGKLYERYERYKKGEETFNGLIKADIDRSNSFMNRGAIDLCPECKQSFLKWLHKPQEEQK